MTRNNYFDIGTLDRNRERTVVFYGRVSTEHEAQLSALENQMQWYSDQAKYHPNWNVIDNYIDEGITGTQAKKRPSFLRMIEDAKSGKFDLIVTREVCRFARNTVDTLNFTRELKNIGVEVYFVEDNIWTMDGDGELRLSLMATLAQEESRKVSERVKAGQRISRENGVLYGSGNILGYDRKAGESYTINPEQAETVRMIFDLYEQGLGGAKIAKVLTERGRKNSSGLVRWDVSYITRVIANATYKGCVCYNKSRSNNYLEQKRITNRDRDSYIYEKGDFEPIITEEQWNKCNELLAKRRIVSKDKFGNTTSMGYNPSADLWQRKLRCTCGSKFRKNVYHKHDDGSKTFCYICYNKLNHGNAANRKKAGLETEGYCDNKTVLQWKMDMMGEFIFDEHWANRAKDMQDALEYIKKYYTQSAPEAVPTFDYEAEIAKLERKLDALIDMRTDGEITKEEYNKKRAEYEAQIKNLRSQATAVSPATPTTDTLDLDKIISALNDISDSKTELGREVLEDIVSSVIPTSEGVYEWHLSTGADTETQTNLAVKGRANSKERPYVYLYGEEADKTASDVHNICIVNFDCLRRLLHRLLLDKQGVLEKSEDLPEIVLSWEFRIDFETAKAFRKSGGNYLRAKQWEDLTVEVRIS